MRCLRQLILQSGYIQADETTEQVLEEVGRSNTAKSFLWAYRGGDRDHLSCVFVYEETRGGDHAREFLTGLKGYLQSDAYSGYDWVEKIEEICPVKCFAHARRYFAECAKLSKKPGLAATA